MKSLARGLAILVFLFIFAAAGRDAGAAPIASIGSSLMFEYAPNGRALETRQPLALRGGWRFSFADVFMEYATFHASQGMPMVSVARTHHEWIAWLRKVVAPSWKLKPFVALGAGAQYDVVETKFDQQSRSDQGDRQVLYTGALGFQADVYKQVELQVESRLSFSSTYAPNPLPSAAVFLGLCF